jgi:hypothetical protein
MPLKYHETIPLKQYHVFVVLFSIHKEKITKRIIDENVSRKLY